MKRIFGGLAGLTLALTIVSCEKEYTCECEELKNGTNRTFTEGSYKTDAASAEKRCFDLETEYENNNPGAAYECGAKEA